MSFLITNIAGSLTIGQVAQQQSTSADQETAEAYQSQMEREIRARTHRLNEEVSATEQDTDKRVGQAPDRRQRGRRSGQPPPAGPPVEAPPDEDILDIHAPVEESKSGRPLPPERPPRQLDITV